MSVLANDDVKIHVPIIEYGHLLQAIGQARIFILSNLN